MSISQTRVPSLFNQLTGQHGYIQMGDSRNTKRIPNDKSSAETVRTEHVRKCLNKTQQLIRSFRRRTKQTAAAAVNYN